MTSQSRLRTIAGTVLATSLAWAVAAFNYWPVGPVPEYNQVPPPGSQVPSPAPATYGPSTAAPSYQAKVAYQPEPAEVNVPAPSLVIPVQGVAPRQLTDTFTQARDSGARVHDAIDIMAPRGTPVLAAAAGTIEALHLSAAGGLTIYLRCDDRRFVLYYAHLDGYAAGLAAGQHVSQGQVIGTVGFTGNASETAPHLHFAVQQTTAAAKWYEPSTAVNPYPLLMRR